VRVCLLLALRICSMAGMLNEGRSLAKRSVL
jgi:hypothetical protein